MMNKKSSFLWFGILVLVVLSLFLVSYVQREKEMDARVRLEATIGHTLFKMESRLNAILESRSLSDEGLERIRDEMPVVAAYAETIDFALSPHALLVPITKNLTRIIDRVEQNNREEDYEQLLSSLETLIPLLHRVYFVPDSKEGAEINLKLNGKKALEDFNLELGEYVSSIGGD